MDGNARTYKKPSWRLDIVRPEMAEQRTLQNQARSKPRDTHAGDEMKTTDNYPPTPELDKMKSVHEKSQAIGEFLDIFLSEKGVQLGKPHKHDQNCAGWDEHRGRYNPGLDGGCSFHTNEFESFDFTIEKLLAEFFGIDLKKCESEREAILNHIRKPNDI